MRALLSSEKNPRAAPTSHARWYHFSDPLWTKLAPAALQAFLWFRSKRNRQAREHNEAHEGGKEGVIARPEAATTGPSGDEPHGVASRVRVVCAKCEV